MPKRHLKNAISGGYRALDELRRNGAIVAVEIAVNEIDVSAGRLNTELEMYTC